MDEGQRRAATYDRLLAQMGRQTYPDVMANEGSDVRRVRIDTDLWRAYAEIVGNGGRSADLKAYIEWRIDNPTTPLPGRRRGPVKKDRRSSADKPAESATSAD